LRLLKLIRRHRQSITLLAIAGILLVIAFYISLQTRSNDRKQGLTVTPHADLNTQGVMPDCSGLTSVEEAIPCYSEAAQISAAMVLSLVDELLDMETDTTRQVAFIESQFAWEEARDAECTFLRASADAIGEGILQELICFTNLNMARLERLEQYQSEWYCTEDCAVESDPGD
jgi:uncharacterized protein YecT (DUF1311 family)